MRHAEPESINRGVRLGTNASRKQVGRPIQPGQVLNPNGINQHTKLRETAEGLFTKEAQKRIRDGDGKTLSQLEAWMASVWKRARSGDAPHLDKLIAERVLPAVQQIQVSDKREREAPDLPAETDRMRDVADVLRDVGALEDAPDALH